MTNFAEGDDGMINADDNDDDNDDDDNVTG